MRRTLALWSALALLAAPVLGDAATLTSRQKTWLSHARRSEKAGWILLHIEGTPEERGFQHGYLLAPEIVEAIRIRREKWHYESGMDWPWLVAKAGKLFTPKVDPEDLAEIDGIVEGLEAAGVPASRDEMVAYNGFFDLARYWWPQEKNKIGSNSPDEPKQSCSSFIATGHMTADGKIILGHNTMFDYPEADANVIIDIVPTRGHRILMQTFPGWVHSGTDFFITDAGLVGSETTIGDFDKFDEKGIPEFVRMRRATQDADSIEEWRAIMEKGNNGGYANAWLLGDIKTNEIARLELGLKYVGFEKTKEGAFTGSNVAENLKILRFETTEHETDIRESSVARRVRWNELMKKYAGRIDVKLAEEFEADHYDTYLDKDNPSGRTLCGHFELDPQSSGAGTPFSPAGTFDGKVVSAEMARHMSFMARWGDACGRPFEARTFLAEHPQFSWMADILKSRPSEPWVEIAAGN
jgi:Phospholipase B